MKLFALLAVGFVTLAASESLDAGLDPRAVAESALANNIVSIATPDGPKEYLLAGGHQYQSLRTRDLAFAVSGALSAGFGNAVRDSLEALFSMQRADGLLPRGADHYSEAERVFLASAGIRLPFKLPLKPWYATETGAVSIDSNFLLPWAASEYIATTGDSAFAAKWYAAAASAVALIQEQYNVDGLIGQQPAYSDWESSIQRTGRVAFTNVIYVLALQGMSSWAGTLGNSADQAGYATDAARVRDELRAHFWDAGLGALYNFDGNRTLSADANLAAVAYGMLDSVEAPSVMTNLQASPLWTPMPGRPTYPDYDSSLKSLGAKFVGLASYHDENYWLWITALAALAESAQGNCAQYDSIIAALEAQLVGDRTVGEIYDNKSGKLVPARRWLYRSERPFTWSAAMYLQAKAAGCGG